jgi:L-ascorbate metabolism protein UlaG (beta-lactamase superfamily)
VCLVAGKGVENACAMNKEATAACRMLGVKAVIPMHFATCSALTGRPAALRDLLEGSGIEIRDLKPGETTTW